MLPLIYGKVDEGYVLVASKGGAPDHPSWYKNLVAEPERSRFKLVADKNELAAPSHGDRCGSRAVVAGHGRHLACL